MENCIRTVDGGGNGFRRADVIGTEVRNLTKIGPVSTVDELLDFACGDLLPKTRGIAYAMAGAIKDHNTVVKSPHIHLLDRKPLGTLTEDRSEKPTIVYHDIEAFVIRMASLMPQLTYFMGITWSSGIGLRIFRNKEILTEAEGGHVPLDPSPYALLCGCGTRGCAESILGGEAVKHRVITETSALQIDIPVDLHPCAFLDSSFDREDRWAVDIYDVISTGMASFLVNIQSILRLPAIVWKGTFASNVLPRIEKDIREKMRRKLINPSWEEEMKFFFSPEPETDSLIGAAVAFVKQLSIS